MKISNKIGPPVGQEYLIEDLSCENSMLKLFSIVKISDKMHIPYNITDRPGMQPADSEQLLNFMEEEEIGCLGQAERDAGLGTSTQSDLPLPRRGKHIRRL